MTAVTTPDHKLQEETLRQGGPEAVLAAAAEVRADIATRADRHDREASFAHENYDAIWAAGLGNLTVPQSRGGLGAGLELSSEVVRQIAAGDASTALVLVMHLMSMKLFDALASESPALQDAVYESSLAGPALSNALRVEPDLGTPARGGVPATRAEPILDQDGHEAWRINGHKIYSTGSHGLRWMLVWGTTKGADGDDLIGFFAVPSDSAGIEIRDTWDHLGMRASASNDVIFTDVVIPRENSFSLVSGADQLAARGSNAALGSWLTVLLLGVYHGVATAARDWLVQYLHERVPSNLGKPLASLPRFQSAVGEIDVRLNSSERLIRTIAQDSDAGGDAAAAAVADAGAAKVIVTRELIEAVGDAVALVGNPGLSYHNPLQRHYRDVLCSRIHTPQDDMVVLALGRSELEQAAR
jgi:alkylation response protein AidB-like acyl-CoA dehydrogenase